MAGIIYYGSILYENDKLSIGSISSFLLYMIQLIQSFAIIALVFGNLFAMVGASEKII